MAGNLTVVNMAVHVDIFFPPQSVQCNVNSPKIRCFLTRQIERYYAARLAVKRTQMLSSAVGL